jgi:hypothetical protein
VSLPSVAKLDVRYIAMSTQVPALNRLIIIETPGYIQPQSIPELFHLLKRKERERYIRIRLEVSKGERDHKTSKKRVGHTRHRGRTM